jgi:hypothetical protein
MPVIRVADHDRVLAGACQTCQALDVNILIRSQLHYPMG